MDMGNLGKTWLFGPTLAVVSGLCGSSQAADLPAAMPFKAPIAASGPYNWTGFYLGASVGGAFGDGSWTEPSSFDASVKPQGMIAGGQIGYNYQINRIVLGVEADGNWTDLAGTDNACFSDPLQSCTTRADWYSTLTGRLGSTMAWDRALLYVKGGGAWGGFRFDNPCAPGDCTSTDYTSSGTLTGWTIGGGFEYAMARNWSIRLEYNYLDFGNHTLFLQGNAGDGGPETYNTHFSTITMGINYLFGSLR
jgi:outer membrane immunogenic protein